MMGDAAVDQVGLFGPEDFQIPAYSGEAGHPLHAKAATDPAATLPPRQGA